jgi:F-type H+-transporting ATPase subunit b
MRFRTLLILLLLAAVPAFYAGAAQTHDSNASGDIAHGAEKDAHEKVHPNEEHGEGHEAPKTYFGIPGWLLKLVNMFLFIGFLYWVAGGPVKSAFAARTAAIKAAAEEAKARRAKADQLATDIQARLTQIEDEVRAIAERAQVEGERQKKELIASAEAEAQKILAAARNEVDNRLKFARKELTEYAGQLAAERAEQILRDKITDADRHKLFAESLREVGEVQS